MHQKKWVNIAIIILVLIIFASCTNTKINLGNNKEIAVQLNKQFKLEKGQTGIVKGYKNTKVTLINVVEPSGKEARFVGLINLRVHIPNEESRYITFEIESQTAPRSYDIDGLNINYEGYDKGVAIFSISK